jgi:hypothetical protein
MTGAHSHSQMWLLVSWVSYIKPQNMDLQLDDKFLYNIKREHRAKYNWLQRYTNQQINHRNASFMQASNNYINEIGQSLPVLWHTH